MLRSTAPVAAPARQTARVVVAHASGSNGGGPHRVTSVPASLDDITKALGACIKEAADMNSLEKINTGIGREICKAAEHRFGSHHHRRRHPHKK